VVILFTALFSINAVTPDEWAARTSPAITGRYTHTAVLTGESMIVWGGYSGSANLNTGAIFKPTENSWTSISTVNAPSARSQHVAVWTGTEMIVWGGANFSQFNTGGRYNPSTDSWVAMSTVNAPSARSFPAAVWTGSEMLVWGGSIPSSFNDGALYNPVTDTWRAVSAVNAPSQRFDPKFVWTGTEFIVWGGNFNNVELVDGAAFNPSNNTWRTIAVPSGFAGRGFIRAVWTGSEMVIWGGGDVTTSSTFVSTGARYNPTADSWTLMSNLNVPQARGHHEIIWTGTEVVIFGGAGTGFVNLNTGGRYDPVTDTWNALSTSSAPTARRHFTAVWTGITMLIYGGFNGSALNTISSWSPADFSDQIPNSWRVTFFGSDYRHKPGAVEDGDPDKDGSTNLVEYEAETSPVDAASGFASSIVMTPSIKWYSVVGRSYRILRKSNLNDPQWTTVLDAYVATSTYSIYFDTSASQPQGYYLVEILPQ
jgi:N-acetylneuraminic acid mutarotase